MRVTNYAKSYGTYGTYGTSKKKSEKALTAHILQTNARTYAISAYGARQCRFNDQWRGITTFHSLAFTDGDRHDRRIKSRSAICCPSR